MTMIICDDDYSWRWLYKTMIIPDGRYDEEVAKGDNEADESKWY